MVFLRTMDLNSYRLNNVSVIKWCSRDGIKDLPQEQALQTIFNFCLPRLHDALIPCSPYIHTYTHTSGITPMYVCVCVCTRTFSYTEKPVGTGQRGCCHEAQKKL